ncbi:MAG: hydroxyacylglutathione hydrolase C-terminal domain-containing protein [Candidatus Caldatribacteriota bacterium]
MIQIKRFFAYNQLRNFSYLLYDDQTGNSWAIDPYEADTFKDYIKKMNLNLVGILNTHQHFDHIRGNESLIEYFGAEVLKKDDVIELSPGNSLEFIDSPGHTMDHQVFLLNNLEKKYLFSGDTFFNSGVGNCKNGGDVETLYLTTQRLLSFLADDTLMYPGHDYSENNLKFAEQFEPENKEIKEALYIVNHQDVEDRGVRTIGEEKKLNPFFALDRLRLRSQFSNMTEKEIFFELRRQRDSW